MKEETILLLVEEHGDLYLRSTSCRIEGGSLHIKLHQETYQIGKSENKSIPGFRGYIRLSAIDRGP